jgi:hypothetical protein
MTDMKRILLSSMLVAMLSACSAKVDEDGAELKVSDDAKESMKESWNTAGREIEKGAEKAKESLQDAGEKIKEGFAEAKDKVTNDDGASVKVEVKKD